ALRAECKGTPLIGRGRRRCWWQGRLRRHSGYWRSRFISNRGRRTSCETKGKDDPGDEDTAARAGGLRGANEDSSLCATNGRCGGIPPCEWWRRRCVSLHVCSFLPL